MVTRVRGPQIVIICYDVTKGSGRAWPFHLLLGEGCTVSCGYSVRQCAGWFQIVLVDRVYSTFGTPADDGDSPYYAVAPMDGIEIRMSHDDESLPLVFRGFVSEVRREEVMGAEGTPERRTIISGQSTGKLLLIQQVYYMKGPTDSDHYMSTWHFFSKYKEASAKLKSAPEFVDEIVNVVLNPAIQVLKAATAMQVSFSTRATVQGSVSPFDVNSFQDRNIYELFSQLCDVGPFNECFVTDEEQGSTIVLRPNQFYTADGSEAHDGVAPDHIEIDHEDIVAISVGRSDASVANVYWVSVPQALQSAHITRVEMYEDRVPDTFWDLRKYDNCLDELYGYRKMEVSARLMAPDNLNPDVLPKDQREPEVNKYSEWMKRRCKSIHRQNYDNVVFETGTLTLKGNEKIKAGMYLVIKRANGVTWQCYAVSIAQHFVPFGAWTTQVQFERGRSYLDRDGGDYAAELSRSRGAVG